MANSGRIVNITMTEYNTTMKNYVKQKLCLGKILMTLGEKDRKNT